MHVIVMPAVLKAVHENILLKIFELLLKPTFHPKANNWAKKWRGFSVQDLIQLSNFDWFNIEYIIK